MRRWAVVAALCGLLVAAPATAQTDPEERILDLQIERTADLQLRVVDVKIRFSDLRGAAKTTESPDEVEIVLATDVLFEFDKASLTPRAEKVLEQVAARIDADAQGTIQIDGYTDSKGSDSYNLDLSLRRARTVRDALARLIRAGLGFEVEGHGEADPVAPNNKPDGSDNPKGRALNRRVEIRFSK
jgi:outer membrane protein OmpA-like peptidoglycan-associated protein